jgi:hypothetical protein
MTSVFSTITLPHWLMIAGTLFLLLGLSGALSRRSEETEPDAVAVERDFKLRADETPEAFYKLVAKGKPEPLLDENVDDPTELLLRLAGPPEFTSRK